MSQSDQALVDAAVKEVLAELRAESAFFDPHYRFHWSAEEFVRLSARVAAKLILKGKGVE